MKCEDDLFITVSFSVALYNVLELLVLIFTKFKRYQGLYFYSLLATTWGVAICGIGLILRLYQVTSENLLFNSLILVGWIGMVTGQSMVLYSRLHLLYRNDNKAKWVLYMIAFDGVICHVPGIVLVYGSYNGPHQATYAGHYSIFERIQITVFSLQEFILSSLYVYKTTMLFRAERGMRGKNTRLFMIHLILVNIVIVLLDVSMLAIEYTGHYDIQIAYKMTVYSIKVKLEFPVLTDLIHLFKGRAANLNKSQNSKYTATSNRMIDSPRRDQENGSTSHAQAVTDNRDIDRQLDHETPSEGETSTRSVRNQDAEKAETTLTTPDGDTTTANNSTTRDASGPRSATFRSV